MFKITCASLLLTLIILVLPCQAGEITASLENYLSDVTAISADTAIQVIVMFDKQADIESLNMQLKQEKATLAERNRRVVQALKDVATKTQGSATAYFDQLMAQGQVKEYQTLWIANMAIVTATEAGIYAMAENDDFADITLSYGIESIKPVDVKPDNQSLISSVESGLRAINAPEAWAAGYTGAGRIVANIDSGVDGDHPAFTDRFLGDTDNDGDYDESWLDPYDETDWESPQDCGSHGTHTMGTICGRTADGDTIGVAIDAKWIAAGAIDRDQSDANQTIEDALESFQWMADPDGNSDTQDNPDAVNNSWGLIPYYHAYPCDETFWSVIDNLEAAGTVVVFSAGNEGDDANSLRSPADRATTDLNAFSVGAVDGNNYNLPIASFSSRGPTYCNSDSSAAIKPEICAPGVYVRSSVPDNGYNYYSGTSMAAPHITGAVALIRQANPNLDVDAVKEVMLATVVDLGDAGPDNNYGQGFLDVYQACLLASTGYGYVEGYVYDEDSEDPIEGVAVTVDGSVQKVYTDASGYYKLIINADSAFAITASKYGYYASTQTGVEVESGQTASTNFTIESAGTGVLYGYITDQDDIPVEDIGVIAADTPLETIYTDSDGYYVFESIAGGTTYTIEISHNDYSNPSDTIYVSAGDSVRLDFSVTLLESFEYGDGGFTSDNDLWVRGIPQNSEDVIAYSGSYVWCTGLDCYSECNGSGCDYSLVSSNYYVTENEASLSYYQAYRTEDGVDGGYVQISTDNGSTWETITPIGGYPCSGIESLDDQPGFSGESLDWLLIKFNLDGYADEYVKMRFRFGANGSTTETGWFIDALAFDGATIVAPDAELSQDLFNVRVDSGESQTQSLTITNNGLADLEFDTRIVTYPPTAGDNAGDEPQDNNGLVTASYGPDEFGYFMYDSDEEDGPEYNWIDISNVGTVASFHGSDMDGYTDLISMGMSFEFYGEEYSDITITTAGYILFDTCSIVSQEPSYIPSEVAPNDVVAVYWLFQDSGEGTCYYYYNSSENQFIVSWLNWKDEMGDNDTYNFQVILDGDDNSILMQYDDVSYSSSDPTIAIENATGEIGFVYPLSVGEEIPDEFAVKYYYPMSWLSISPMTGTISSGSSQSFDVAFSAGNLADNWYYADVNFTTNDPHQEVFTVNCNMGIGSVSSVDDVDAALPSVLSLDQNFPNPFNPTTEIMFNVPEQGYVTLDVYNVLGRKVTTLVDEELAAGTHNVIWNSTNSDGDKVTSGIYFYKLSQNDNSVTKKMVLIK